MANHRSLKNEKTRISAAPPPPRKFHFDQKIMTDSAAGGGGEAQLIVCRAIVASRNLTEAAERLSPALLEIETQLSRLMVLRTDATKEFVTLAATDRVDSGIPFSVSKEVLRQARHGRVAHYLPVATRTGNRYVAVIPILASTATPIFLHAEFDGAAALDVSAAVAKIQNVMSLAIPKLEALCLSERLDGLLAGMVTTINAAVEAKDTYTCGHSERVARYSVSIGGVMGLGQDQLDLLFLSGLCHDIGKIGVADGILKKPGLLSAEEFQEMKAHPVIGAEIIQNAPNAAALLAGIEHHHERWDGSGYPHGLEGEKIPLFARVIAVADAFDAMTSGRSYSGYMNQEEAAGSLAEKTDIFDPDILGAFISAERQGALDMRTGTMIGLPKKTGT